MLKDGMVGQAYDSAEFHDSGYGIFHWRMGHLIEDREDILNGASGNLRHRCPHELLRQRVEIGNAANFVCCDHGVAKTGECHAEPLLAFKKLPGVLLTKVHLAKDVIGEEDQASRCD